MWYPYQVQVFQFLLNQSFQLAATAPDLGRAVVVWALWSPSLSSAATVLTSRNHLTGWAIYQLPTSKLLGVPCKPKRISSSGAVLPTGCSSFLVSLFVWQKTLKQVRRVFRESSWSDLYREIVQLPSCTLSFMDQIFICQFFPEVGLIAFKPYLRFLGVKN